MKIHVRRQQPESRRMRAKPNKYQKRPLTEHEIQLSPENKLRHSIQIHSRNYSFWR